jgi:3-hydroxyisobutyrate dehydrogenase-like beta-hydroxyacid dehydrogenase
MTHIALLGLGAMGSRMGANLLKAGNSLTVWNRSPGPARSLRDSGAKVAATPRSAATDADIVISMVRDDAASRHVWLDPAAGALQGMKSGSVAIESSTLSLEWIQDLVSSCTAHRVDFLDAPVLGSRPQAAEAKLIYLVGGATATVERVKPVLQALGSVVHVTGKVGTGAAMKLVANALFGIQVAAVAELLGLIQRQGIELAHAVEILGATPLLSPAAKGAATQMLSGDFSPLFPAELVEKDLGYATHAAAQHNSDAPLIEATRKAFANALSRGMGAENLTGIVRLYRTDKLSPDQ